MIHPIHASDVNASMGISPFETVQESPRLGWWRRVIAWMGRWARRLLPFMFLLMMASGEEMQAPTAIPDKLVAKYWKARTELAVAIQEMTAFCKGDFGFTPSGDLACVPHPVVSPSAQPEDKK